MREQREKGLKWRDNEDTLSSVRRDLTSSRWRKDERETYHVCEKGERCT